MRFFTLLHKMPLWNLGFRPFFLFGILWAVIQIGFWISFQRGWLAAVPLPNALVWHGHEMVFGYVLAIIAGFILTASQNWTGIPGIKGGRLSALVLVWGAARVLSFFWAEVPLLFAVVDLAFVPLLALFLLPYLWRPSQKQNRVFFVLFSGFFLSNLIIHLSVFEINLVPVLRAIHFAIYLSVLMIALIGGRVIPFFAGVVLPNVKVKALLWLEWSSAVSLALFSLATLFESSSLTVFVSIPAFALQFFRWWRWRPWSAYRIPVLFVLYLSYIWIPIGILLTAFSSLGYLAPSLAIHAFTIGCIGLMVFGMISRVALGHTGREIRPPLIIVFGYLCLFIAAVVRVFFPWMYPEYFLLAIEISGCLWILAHLFFLYIYSPILLSRRADGREG